MTNITDLAERRRLRNSDRQASFVKDGLIHVTVTLSRPDEIGGGLFLPGSTDIEYVHDLAPATYAGLVEMPPQREAEEIPEYAVRQVEGEIRSIRWNVAVLFIGWILGALVGLWYGRHHPSYGVVRIEEIRHGD